MKKKILVIGIVSMFLLTSAVSLSAGETIIANDDGDYTPHDNIMIDGDDDFTSENGVTGGSGTEEDPYIIEGWEVETILIRFTTAYFIIRDCFVDLKKDYILSALGFIDVSNGIVYNCTISGDEHDGIFLDLSNNCLIDYCTISSDGRGIEIHNSQDNVVSNCDVYNCHIGILIWDLKEGPISTNNEIYGCDIWSCSCGFEIRTPGNKIHHNNLFRNCDNIRFLLDDYEPKNQLDDGLGEGNYWDDYTGKDDNGDGIGDTPLVFRDLPWRKIAEDRWPLMKAWGRESEPPNKPTIDGPATGKPREKYYFSVVTTDPDGHAMKYGLDWNDDGKVDKWTRSKYYESGEIAEVNHTWNWRGTYKIRVIAKDMYGYKSDWSDPLTVIMPRNKAVHNTLFLKLLEHFPMLERLLTNFFVIR